MKLSLFNPCQVAWHTNGYDPLPEESSSSVPESNTMALFQRKPIREKRNFIVAMYPEEHAALTFLADKYGISMTEVVLRALANTYGNELPQEYQSDETHSTEEIGSTGESVPPAMSTTRSNPPGSSAPAFHIPSTKQHVNKR
jgi:hypothetical protein